MVRKYLIPLLAVVGVTFAIWTVVSSSRQVPAAPPVTPPARAPFASYVAGSGIIEANRETLPLAPTSPAW